MDAALAGKKILLAPSERNPISQRPNWRITEGHEGLVRTLWETEPFVGFGGNPFAPSPRPVRLAKVAGRSKVALHEGIRKDCPKTPGVYGMIDANGHLIYVGKSKSLRSRLLSYFGRPVRKQKAGAILRETRRIVWERQPSEFAALLRELHLIRTWRPRWNVKDQPKAQLPVYVAVGRAPATYLFVTSTPPKDSIAFGPFQSRGRVHTAVEVLNQHYGLRDCTGNVRFLFSDQPELFPQERRPGCLRYEIGTCLGPCVGGCSSSAYNRQVRGATAFLEGDDESPIVVLRDRMLRAAAEQRYETAAQMRDRLGSLEWLSSRLDYLQRARSKFNFIYPVRSTSGRTVWYAIHRGCVAKAMWAPTARRRAPHDEELLASWARLGRLDGFPVMERHPTINLLSHWFRTRDGEMDQVISIEKALDQFRAITSNWDTDQRRLAPTGGRRVQ